MSPQGQIGLGGFSMGTLKCYLINSGLRKLRKR
jgi:hypothetical protein